MAADPGKRPSFGQMHIAALLWRSVHLPSASASFQLVVSRRRYSESWKYTLPSAEAFIHPACGMVVIKTVLILFLLVCLGTSVILTDVWCVGGGFVCVFFVVVELLQVAFPFSFIVTLLEPSATWIMLVEPVDMLIVCHLE